MTRSNLMAAHIAVSVLTVLAIETLQPVEAPSFVLAPSAIRERATR